MEASFIISLTMKTLYLVLVLSLPTVLVAAIIGVGVSFIQAITQIQEQTLSFAFKLIAIFITLVITGRWMGSEIYELTLSIYELFPAGSL